MEKLICGISFTCAACGEACFCEKKQNHVGECAAFDIEYHSPKDVIVA